MPMSSATPTGRLLLLGLLLANCPGVVANDSYLENLTQVSIATMSGKPNQPWLVSVSLTKRPGQKCAVISCGGNPRIIDRRTLVSSGIIQSSAIGARGLVAHPGEYYITIDPYVPLAEPKSGKCKVYRNGAWRALANVRYYEASMKFRVWRAAAKPVHVEVIAVTNKRIAAIKIEGQRNHILSGTLEVRLVPDCQASFGKVTIGPATSGEETGNGLAHGDWHAPRPHLRQEQSSVVIDKKPIEDAPCDALWTFQWRLVHVRKKG